MCVCTLGNKLIFRVDVAPDPNCTASNASEFLTGGKHFSTVTSFVQKAITYAGHDCEQLSKNEKYVTSLPLVVYLSGCVCLLIIYLPIPIALPHAHIHSRIVLCGKVIGQLQLRFAKAWHLMSEEDMRKKILRVLQRRRSSAAKNGVVGCVLNEKMRRKYPGQKKCTYPLLDALANHALENDGADEEFMETQCEGEGYEQEENEGENETQEGEEEGGEEEGYEEEGDEEETTDEVESTYEEESNDEEEAWSEFADPTEEEDEEEESNDEGEEEAVLEFAGPTWEEDGDEDTSGSEDE